MGFSLKKAFKHVVNPVFSLPAKAIESVSGVDWKGQLGVGAGIGTGAGIFRALRGGNAGAGPSAVGATEASGGSAGGMMGSPLFSGLGTAAFGAGLNYLGEREARGQDLASAREQMDFQEHMSSTAHQREVADLRAAGLNPVLSANSGASTPAGQSIDAENMAQGLLPSIASAVGLQEAKSRIGLQSAQARNLNVDSRHRELDLPPHAKTSGWKTDILGLYDYLRPIVREMGAQSGKQLQTIKSARPGDFNPVKFLHKNREYREGLREQRRRKPNTFYAN